MRGMKLSTVAMAAGLALGAALSYVPSSEAAERPAQNGCVTETHRCSSGSCSRPIPDGGVSRNPDGGGGILFDSDAGISLAFLQGYTVSVCGTAARPLAGAGTLQDYHCKPPAQCAVVSSNALTVTLTGTTATPCQEFPPFVIPASLPAVDRMIWASSGVTISNWDGGTADTISVTVCPTQ